MGHSGGEGWLAVDSSGLLAYLRSQLLGAM